MRLLTAKDLRGKGGCCGLKVAEALLLTLAKFAELEAELEAEPRSAVGILSLRGCLT